MAEALIEEARRELVRTFEVLARMYGYQPGRVAGEPTREEPEALDPQQLLERLEEFRKFCEVDLSLQSRTVEGYVGRVKMFLQWCRASDMPASPSAIREFLSQYEAANSRANYLKAFRRFFRDFLGREDIIRHSIEEHLLLAAEDILGTDYIINIIGRAGGDAKGAWNSLGKEEQRRVFRYLIARPDAAERLPANGDHQRK